MGYYREVAVEVKAVLLACALALPPSPLKVFMQLMDFVHYRYPRSSFCFVEEHEHPLHEDGWRYTELRWQKFRIFERQA